MTVIRTLQAKDKAEWQVLWRGYLDFYKTKLASEIYEVAFTRLLDENSPQFCFVAEKDGELIGLVHYIFHRSMWTIDDYVYLQDLYLSEASRGTGSGRLLIEAVYEEAKLKGANRVHWLTSESNETAMLLYDRIATKTGFIQYRKML